jgi:hypothetical protein
LQWIQRNTKEGGYNAIRFGFGIQYFDNDGNPKNKFCDPSKKRGRKKKACDAILEHDLRMRFTEWGHITYQPPGWGEMEQHGASPLHRHYDAKILAQRI